MKLLSLIPGAFIALLTFFSGVMTVLTFTTSRPAYALEKKVFESVTVPAGTTVSRASTVWGDVNVYGDVTGDVSSGFGNIQVNGPVGGDVETGFGSVKINAPVQGSIDVGHGDVYLEPQARVNGNISIGSGKIFREQGAVVRGAQMAGAANDFGHAFKKEAEWPLSSLLGWFLMTVGLIASGVLAAVILPKPLTSAARNLETLPVRALLLGIVSLPAAVILSVLLAVTVIGIPLLLLAVPAYMALMFFGVLVTAYLLGRRISIATGRYHGGDVMAAGLGAFLVSAMYLIPIFGGLIFFILAILGTGAAISAMFPGGRSAPALSYEAYLRERRGN